MTISELTEAEEALDGEDPERALSLVQGIGGDALLPPAAWSALDRAKFHELLARLQVEAGEPDDAAASFERAIALEALGGEPMERQAATWSRLGGALADGDRLDEAKAAFERALALLDQAGAPPADRASVCIDYGFAMQMAEELSGAAQAYKMAAEWAEKAGEGRRELGRVYLVYASVLRPMVPVIATLEGEGDAPRGAFLAEAERASRRAMDDLQAGQGDPSEVLDAARGLGEILAYRGKLEEAERVYELALRLADMAGLDEVALAVVWFERGRARQLAARHEDALAAFTKADALEESGGADDESRARTWDAIREAKVSLHDEAGAAAAAARVEAFGGLHDDEDEDDEEEEDDA